MPLHLSFWITLLNALENVITFTFKSIGNFMVVRKYWDNYENDVVADATSNVQLI